MKSKEQKRAEALARSTYPSYFYAQEEIPFICGGYSQADWDYLMGLHIDMEFADDYCDPFERASYIFCSTKPAWA